MKGVGIETIKWPLGSQSGPFYRVSLSLQTECGYEIGGSIQGVSSYAHLLFIAVHGNEVELKIMLLSSQNIPETSTSNYLLKSRVDETLACFFGW